MDGRTERSWLDQADIVFDEYHLIDERVQKEEAQKIIQHASVIFLLGGNPIEQNGLLMEYDLSELIKKSSAVVMGASAGAINMSAKWLFCKYTGNKDELSSLSEKMNVYASNKDCAVRVKGDTIDILGDVFFISNAEIQKLDEMHSL